jgi:hypothetical protein
LGHSILNKSWTGMSDGWNFPNLLYEIRWQVVWEWNIKHQSLITSLFRRGIFYILVGNFIMIRFIANEGNLQEISINLENVPIRKEKH